MIEAYKLKMVGPVRVFLLDDHEIVRVFDDAPDDFQESRPGRNLHRDGRARMSGQFFEIGQPGLNDELLDVLGAVGADRAVAGGANRRHGVEDR